MAKLQQAIQFLRRVRRKPVRYLLHRVLAEARVEGGRITNVVRDRRFGERELLRATGAVSLDALWSRLQRQPYPASFTVDERSLDEFCPGERARILAAAAAAMERRVDMLGSGPVELGSPIDWSLDFKTGRRWPRGYALRMHYNDPELPSDVKVPWEVSRLQWLIPLGQAYRLTGDEQYASAARAVLDEWIVANPYSYSVVWGVTMEVALRILSWSWLFHAFARSRAWADSAFRLRFLRTLYLHGEFTERYIERSDINGNHYTADAAALVVAGLFFGEGADAHRWHQRGWSELCRELPLQVFGDGVDFEASAAYHRLVGELFLLAARAHALAGGTIPDFYRQRLLAMAHFVATSARPDGRAPLWGDGDDARALPLGGQPIDDHRHFVGQTALLFQDVELARLAGGPLDEAIWSDGPAGCAWLAEQSKRPVAPTSRAFAEGGVYVMRDAEDWVFIDCGPIGLRGRGGHGHNDSLSFEAVLCGRQLVTDCGSYLYTASYAERNRFRSTASHNTPRVDQQEINRFAPLDIWIMQNDALPDVRHWSSTADEVRFVGAHRGYERLTPSLRPLRTIRLDPRHHRLAVSDRFETTEAADFEVDIPLHLAAGVSVVEQRAGELVLAAAGERFRLLHVGQPQWQLEVSSARVAPRYGVTLPIVRLRWQGRARLDSSLLVLLAPLADDVDELLAWGQASSRTARA